MTPRRSAELRIEADKLEAQAVALRRRADDIERDSTVQRRRALVIAYAKAYVGPWSPLARIVMAVHHFAAEIKHDEVVAIIDEWEQQP